MKLKKVAKDLNIDIVHGWLNYEDSVTVIYFNGKPTNINIESLSTFKA
jgi:hypothetical protein